jgi:DNA polymerase-3 subunit chi
VRGALGTVDVAFYHATRDAADAVAPRLIQKALDAGHRVALRAADPARLAALDGLLWTHDATSFLPHGVAGGPFDARQPCLLMANDGRPANGATVLVLLDPPLPADGFARVLLLFDEATRDAARGAWKAWEGPATYWKQGPRGWEKAAAKP